MADFTNLTPAERPRRAWRYVVEGVGGFAFDMLRYDEAWPADEMQIVPMLDDTAPRRRISLRSYRAPTIGRWESFGWRVVSEDEESEERAIAREEALRDEGNVHTRRQVDDR